MLRRAIDDLVKQGRWSGSSLDVRGGLIKGGQSTRADRMNRLEHGPESNTEALSL
jgi:hypothetical protein